MTDTKNNLKDFAKSYRLRKAHKDQMPGGKADNKKPSDFNPKSLIQGMKVEMEHTNDKSKAREIAMDHLTEDPKYYEKLKEVEKSKTTDNIACGDGLSGKICRRNTSKTNDKKTPKSFAKEFKKSYDYRDHGVMIDAKDQQAAEETINPKILNYLQEQFDWMNKGDVRDLKLGGGTLKLSKKDEGLYNGWFEDMDGQVSEKFDDQTIAMVAKNLVLKGWIGEEVIPEEIVLAQPEPEPAPPAHIRIKCGDFEFELRKSLVDFAKSWKNPEKTDLKKAISVWKKHRVKHTNEKQAVKELLENWDQYGEDFSQVLFAVQQSKGE